MRALRAQSWVLLDCGLVAALAVAIRLIYVARSTGGFGGNFGYDAAVYYSAADALTFGRMPYGDFTLLHPPGIVLALAPFAALGRLTTDHAGYEIANTAFAVIGAINAALVTAVARRLGVARVAALVGGLGYAVWYTAYVAEFSIRLEPLGNLATLLGLFLLLPGGRRIGRTASLVGAGACFGVAASVKIWWLAPLAVAIVWTLIESRSVRRTIQLIAGAAGAIALITLPFFINSPRHMVRMVILDQLGRPKADDTLRSRLEIISGLGTINAIPPGTKQTIYAALVVAAVIVFALGAWRVAAARLPVLLMVVNLGVLLAGPSIAFYYPEFFAAPFCVCGAVSLGVALRIARRQAWGRAAAGAVLALAGVSVLAVLGSTANLMTKSTGISSPFPSHRLQPVAAKVHCLVADTPMAQILLDSLSRDLGRGCPNWIDVTGYTYGPARLYRNGIAVPRDKNPKWQRALRRYLTSGGGVILIRSATSANSRTLDRVTRGGPLGHAEGFTIYRSPTAPAD